MMPINQSICGRRRFDRKREKKSELSIKIYRTNSVNKFDWDKNQQNEIK
jgi:hypothetical protein